MPPAGRSQAQQRVAEPSMPFTPWAPQEIVNFYYGGLNIDCSQEDVVKPTQAFVMQFYSKILEDSWKITTESAAEHRMVYLNMLAYGKELYDEPLKFAMFFKHLRDLAFLCGVPSFSHADLLRPEPIRFRSIVTAIANFLKFRTANGEFFDQQVERLDMHRESIVRLEEELAAVNAEIEQINDKNEENAPFITEARHRNEALEAENSNLRIESGKVYDTAAALKGERSVIIAEVQHKVDHVVALQDGNERIRMRIVKSPEKLKKNLEEMTRQQSELRTNLRDCSRKGRELATRLDVMAGLELDLKGLIDLVQGIESDKKKLSDLKMTLQRTSNVLGERDIENNAAISKIEQLERQIKLANEKLARQVQSGEEMRQQAKEEMDNLKAEYAAKAKDRTATLKEVEGRRGDKKAVEEEMRKFKDEQKKQMDTLLAEYIEIRNAMEEYMEALHERLGLSAFNR